MAGLTPVLLLTLTLLGEGRVSTLQHTPKVLVAAVPPFDLSELRQLGADYRAVIVATLERSGKVKYVDLQTPSPSPRFDRELETYAAQWKFEPVENEVEIEIVYALKFVRSDSSESTGIFFIQPTTVEIRLIEPPGVTIRSWRPR